MGARHRFDARLRPRQEVPIPAPCGWDDPVPSECDSVIAAAEEAETSHDLEREVQRRLLDEPGLKFASLVVRRMRDGVCIQGVLETETGLPDLSLLARQVRGVDRVVDQVVVRHVSTPSPSCC
ncbi:MAG: hypothetical protein KF774_11495 [Planctomyces sp.]|nr:hypothetical protein [Planctomyces sp.]